MGNFLKKLKKGDGIRTRHSNTISRKRIGLEKAKLTFTRLYYEIRIQNEKLTSRHVSILHIRRFLGGNSERIPFH
jgi:hypothetical protein